MKILSILAIVVLATLVFTFMVQNLGAVTVSFLNSTLTLPVSMLVLLVYVAGMLTGGFFVNLLRGWLRRATADEAPKRL